MRSGRLERVCGVSVTKFQRRGRHFKSVNMIYRGSMTVNVSSVAAERLQRRSPAA